MKGIYFAALLTCKLSLAAAQTGGTPEAAAIASMQLKWFYDSKNAVEQCAVKSGAHYGELLQNYATILMVVNLPDSAEKYYQLSGRVLSKDPGIYSEPYITLLNTYGNFLLKDRSYASARSIGERMVAIVQKMTFKGIDAYTLSYSSEFLGRIKDITNARVFLAAARKLPDLSNYSHEGKSSILLRFALAESLINGRSEEAVRLFSTSTDELTAHIEERWNNLDGEHRNNLLSKFFDTGSQILSWISDDPSPALCKSYLRLQETLKRRTINAINTPGHQQSSSDEFYSSLKASLGDKEILLNFVKYAAVDADHIYTHDKFFGMFVISNKRESPIFVKLCSEEELSDLIYDNENQIRAPGDLYVTPGAGGNQTAVSFKLNDLLIRKLKPYITGAKNIYYVAEGSFSFINLAALSDQQGYLGDKYEFMPLSNSSSLFNLSKINIGGFKRFSILGGLDYDPSLQLDELKYSAEEVRSASKSISIAGYRASVDSGKNINGSRFFALQAARSDVLHISTHGYMEFAGPDDLTTDPLTRCGIFLSDRKLSAAEISSMDFSTVRLGILSACNTGVGDLNVGEGVSGLYRAFQRAGVAQLLISLNPVEDERTATFIGIFYRHLLVSGSAVEAFSGAIKEFRVLSTEKKSLAWTNWILIR